ncbi:MAG: hypothetical protein ACRD0Q_03715 [Acidimicrobiales bacterium]
MSKPLGSMLATVCGSIGLVFSGPTGTAVVPGGVSDVASLRAQTAPATTTTTIHREPPLPDNPSGVVVLVVVGSAWTVFFAIVLWRAPRRASVSRRQPVDAESGDDDETVGSDP